MNYRVFLAEEVWTFIDQQELDVKEWIHHFRNLPETGDFTELSPIDGRALDIKIISDYAITYFVDHAVKEIKVVDVESADR